MSLFVHDQKAGKIPLILKLLNINQNQNKIFALSKMNNFQSKKNHKQLLQFDTNVMLRKNLGKWNSQRDEHIFLKKSNFLLKTKTKTNYKPKLINKETLAFHTFIRYYQFQDIHKQHFSNYSWICYIFTKKVNQARLKGRKQLDISEYRELKHISPDQQLGIGNIKKLQFPYHFSYHDLIHSKLIILMIKELPDLIFNNDIQI